MAFKIKRGDTRRVGEVPLRDNFGTPNEEPVPGLDTADAIVFIMRLTTSAPDAVPKVRSPAMLVDPADALVRYIWVAGDTDTAGAYNAEIEVTWAPGQVETFPNDGYW